MNLVNIGTILKKAIKDKGFTQEEFAEKTGIGLSSLRKYISGQIAYTVELLEKFAETLGCSYDYLLGKSLTPNREIQDIKAQTRLTDEALKMLTTIARGYESARENRRYIDTLSYLIQTDFLLLRITEYFYLEVKLHDFVDEEWDGPKPSEKEAAQMRAQGETDIEDTFLLSVLRTLIETKVKIKSQIPLE